MTYTRTGKTRYRIQHSLIFSDLVVLQVEWKVTGREHWSNDGGRVECESLPDTLEWKDATIYDLQELNLL